MLPIMMEECDGKSNCTFNNKDPIFMIGSHPDLTEEENKKCKDAIYKEYSYNLLELEFEYD